MSAAHRYWCINDKVNCMIRVVMLLVVALMLVSCGSTVSSPLNATAWQLMEVNGSGYTEQKTPILRFGNAKIEGEGFCNTYTAAYQVNGDALTVTSLVATEMACEDLTLNILESDYFGTLRAVTRYAIVGDELQLFDPNGTAVVLLRKIP